MHYREFIAPRRLKTTVVVLTIAVLFALTLIQSISIWNNYQENIQNVEQHSSQLAHILAEHMRNSIEAVDSSLTQIAIQTERLGGPAADSDLWQPVLRSAIAGMSHVGSLSITDANGTILHSTIPSLIGQSRKGQFLFHELKSNPKAGLLADTPFQSQFSGKIIIPIGRRLTSSDGTFHGIVAATLLLDSFRTFYRSIDTGVHGVIWVIHPTGLVMVREPQIGNHPEKTNAPVILQNQLMRKDKGILTSSFVPNEDVYITSWRAVEAAPMFLAVSINKTAALNIWRRDSLISAAFTILFVFIVGAVSRQLLRQINARATVEHALIHRERELTEAQRIAGLGAVRFALPDFSGSPSHQLRLMLGLSQGDDTLSLNMFLKNFSNSNREVLQNAFQSCAATHVRCELEVTLNLPDFPERIFWTEVVADDSEGQDKTSILATFQDVTKQRLTEQRSNQAQRLAAVGTLTGGVAHDFNNLLAAILGYSEIVLMHLKQDDPNRKNVEQIIQACDRAAGLTKQLLAFSRKQVLQPKVFDLNQVVANMDNMLRRLIGETIGLTTHLNQDLGRIKAGFRAT